MSACLTLSRVRPRGAADADRLRVVVVRVEAGSVSPLASMLARAGGARLEVASVVGVGPALADLAAHPAAMVVLHADDPAAARVGIKAVKRGHPALPAVCISDSGSAEAAVQVVRAGAEDCLTSAALTGPHLLRVILCALERTSHAASLRTQVVTDPLTGLPNRQALQSALERALARARRQGKRFAVLFADLDGFKTVNDRHGHERGDRVLQEIARRFAARTRDVDTVARVGGDEFVMVIEDLDDPRHAAGVATKLLHAASEPVVIEGQTSVLGASVGISLYPGDGEDAATLLRHADHAMYAAKAAGSRQLRYYQARLNEHARVQSALDPVIERALTNSEFELHYQPVWHTTERRIASCEALLRWRRPGHGLLAPGDFLDAVERAGLGVRVAQWTIAEACRMTRRLADAGFDVPVSVNLTRAQVGDARVIDAVREGLSASGLASSALQIELNERVFGGGDPRVTSALSELARLGVPVVVDDVGCGTTSLLALTKTRVTALKIDGALTRALPGGPAAEAMVSALVALARPLGMAVVAEGVESDAQARALGSLGCDHAQGYFYGHGLPGDEWMAYLRWACTAIVGSDRAGTPPAKRPSIRGSRARVVDLPGPAERLAGPALPAARGEVVVGRFRNH